MEQPEVAPGLKADELLHQLRQREQLRFFEFQRQMRSLLAVIRAITRRSALTARSTEELAAHLEGRIDALARVQGILLRLPDARVDLAELVSGEFLAHAVPENHIEISGPQVSLTSKAAASLALALHELTTNALKFGALSTPSGRLSIVWGMDRNDASTVRLEWTERGVQMPSPAPSHKGFGLELIERTLPYELRAQTALEFTPDGIHCVIAFQPGPQTPRSEPSSEDRTP
jgi:two-component system, chemotaxis family, CheB/CheR fusion protein